MIKIVPIILKQTSVLLQQMFLNRLEMIHIASIFVGYISKIDDPSYHAYLEFNNLYNHSSKRICDFIKQMIASHIYHVK